MKTLAMFLFLLLLAVPVLASDRPAYCDAQDPLPRLTDAEFVNYCHGPGCPTRYEIEGFDVWTSPNLPCSPDYTDDKLDRILTMVQAQLVLTDALLPDVAMGELRRAGISILIEDPANPSRWSEWRGRLNWRRLVAKAWGPHSMVAEWEGGGWFYMMWVLHEMAHAYHYNVIGDGPGNTCIIDTYDRNKHRYYGVEDAPQASGIPPHEGVRIYDAYATTNYAEYFAELTVTYFMRGGSFPWSRLDLYDLDPDGYHMIRDAWNDPMFCQR